MNMNDVLQYAAYVLVAIGMMAFLVSVITQVIKELPCFKPVPTGGIGGTDGLAVPADNLVYDFCVLHCSFCGGPGCYGRLGARC